MDTSAHPSCSLCRQILSSHPIVDQALRFCCGGCQAVYAILSIRGEVEDYHENPLFLQAVRSGLISNPALLEQIREKKMEVSPGECERIYFEIREMWCPSCAEVISLILLQEKGVKSCAVDYATDIASMEYLPRTISKDALFKRIQGLGYLPVLLEDAEHKALSQTLYLRFAIAAFCAFNAMMFAYPLYAIHLESYPEDDGRLFAWLSFFISLPVVTYAGWPILRRFWSSLSVGIVGMEALVTLGVGSAFALSIFELLTGGTYVYFDSMSVIVAFVLLGKIIENKAKFSAKQSLYRLNLALPKRGRKRQSDGFFSFVPLKEIEVGDVVEVRMGEMVVLDGVVLKGEGICNEALMSGEPVPVPKKEGCVVAGGTLLQHGRLLITISATSEGSTLQRIVDLIAQQMSGKLCYFRPADAIVRWFVPSVLSVAFMAAALCWAFGVAEGGRSVEETAFLRAIAILLISCPCAIGIAAPTAEAALIRALASHGAIVRHRGCLRFLGKETIFVFDKTGTITEGRFTVLQGLEQLTNEEKQILKALVENSNHPIAFAINHALSVKAASLGQIEEFTGKGIRGFTPGANGSTEQAYLVGSALFMSQEGCELAVQTCVVETAAIGSIVYFCKKGQLAKALVLGDRLKKEAQSIIADFSRVGIKTALVSGDSESTVSRVAKECGFTQWIAQASPLDKQQYVENLKAAGEIITFVGDGINDSPALTTAHAGISVATASDVSIQVSDVLLTADHLTVLPQLCTLAQKGRRIIWQNLFWAFFYNVIGIGLAAFGWLSPIFAAFAMTISSLMVLFNAMRLRN